ncbi:hypothetical protein P7K49_009382 [Saguinus oedipus]|uniref:Uncharacterized protein n=1 Tax=Saguinus oedipus TaxID=9490 RepID=A0ABQ9VJU0_SAGOE|nr:hypothetical protein P7K49_009382 [Saguinus oedipus]
MWFTLKQSLSKVSLQVVINGGATSSGEQDNEDTELMAIYTTENGIAEKTTQKFTHTNGVPDLGISLAIHSIITEVIENK